MFASPLLNPGGVNPPFDGRTPVFVEVGADPSSLGLDLPPGSIAKWGTSYYRKFGPNPYVGGTSTTLWELIGGEFGTAIDVYRRAALAALGPSAGSPANIAEDLCEFTGYSPAADWQTNGVGAGSLAHLDEVGGVVRVLSSAVPANSYYAFRASNANGGPPCLVRQSASWRFSARLRLDANIGAADTIMACGLGDISGLYMAVGQRGTASATKVVARFNAGASPDLVSAVDLAIGAWYEVVVQRVGGVAMLSVNGGPWVTSTTADVSARCCLAFHSLCGAAAVDRTFSIQRMHCAVVTA